MGDTALLAGSPADAADHYGVAAELARNCSDWIWCAAALQGLAHAKARPAPVAVDLTLMYTRGKGPG